MRPEFLAAIWVVSGVLGPRWEDQFSPVSNASQGGRDEVDIAGSLYLPDVSSITNVDCRDERFTHAVHGDDQEVPPLYWRRRHADLIGDRRIITCQRAVPAEVAILVK